MKMVLALVPKLFEVSFWGGIILRELTTKSISGCEDHQIIDSTASEKTFGSLKQETVWVEGLVPGIDFCNHGV